MRTADVDDTLDFLIGTWRLRRALTDHRTGTSGSFTGTAAVRPLGCAGGPATGGGSTRGGSSVDAAVYEEIGSLRLGGHEGPARRELRWVRAGGGVHVLFADGRPFFDLDLREGSCRVEHRCRADLYELSFELSGAGRIQERWRVRGPAKHYDAVTSWSRCGG